MAESSASQITGDDIISELIHNAQVGLFKVRYTVLLPCRFNVYLHEHDFDLIQPVAEVVRREAKTALTEHLNRLNKARVQPRLIKRLGLARPETKATYKILEKDWTVEFHRSDEERLRPGEIEIYSDLGTEHKVELGAGAMTTFVTRHSSEQPASPSPSAQGSPVQTYATLRYTDAQGEKTFAMTRDEIVVGRGGKAVWVDLKLDAPPDVSREHCRIRRDTNTGQLFIKDLSQYGTAVNGGSIPTSVERSEHGDKVERNVEVPLPAAAKIVLAGVLVIDFQAGAPQ